MIVISIIIIIIITTSININIIVMSVNGINDTNNISIIDNIN